MEADDIRPSEHQKAAGAEPGNRRQGRPTVLSISKTNEGGGAWAVRGRTGLSERGGTQFTLIEHLSFSLLECHFFLYCGSFWSPFNLVLPHILPVLE